MGNELQREDKNQGKLMTISLKEVYEVNYQLNLALIHEIYYMLIDLIVFHILLVLKLIMTRNLIVAIILAEIEQQLMLFQP